MILAVSALHRHGITHRDLRLENFLLVGNVIKIADLGLASKHTFMYTLNVQMWWYRAPELFLQQQPYTCSVDLWALGMLLIHLQLGHFPFQTTETDMLNVIFKSRHVATPCNAKKLSSYLPSPCAEYPPLRRWHDCLTQLNPYFRKPIASVESDVDVTVHASMSALDVF